MGLRRLRAGPPPGRGGSGCWAICSVAAAGVALLVGLVGAYVAVNHASHGHDLEPLSHSQLIEQLEEMQRQLMEAAPLQHESAALPVAPTQQVSGAPDRQPTVQADRGARTQHEHGHSSPALAEPVAVQGAEAATTDSPSNQERIAVDVPTGGSSTAMGTLFTWGLGGPRAGRDGDTTVPGRALQGMQVASVSGSAHTLAVVQGGEVWSMGRNDSHGGGGHGSQAIADSGQLGRSGGEKAAMVKALMGKRAVQVAAGRYHSVALTEAGEVFTWGLNDVGQLGRRGTTTKTATWDDCVEGYSCRSGWPFSVGGALEGVEIAAISAGRYWTLAASRDGRLFTWGMDGCATGVLPARSELWKPRLVGGALKGKHVVAMDSGYILWVARTSEGEAYTCNTQDDGYAGTLPQKNSPNHVGELGREIRSPSEGYVPGKVALPDNEKAISVAAGRQHGMAVTSPGGNVYSWGQGGSLLGRPGSRNLPAKIPSFGQAAGHPATLVAAGEYFSLVATATAVWGFGGNGYHMGGIGHSVEDIKAPRMTMGELSQGSLEVLDLQAGYQHAMAIARPAKASQAPAVAPGPVAEPQQAPLTVQAARAAPMAAGWHRRPAHQHVSTAADHVSYLKAQAKPPEESVAEAWANWKWTQRHTAIVGTSRDIFDNLPEAFDPGYRNPCWRQNGQLRCLPYFQILGVSKCGTTDLYHRLAKHPELKESTNKGPHFWDECPWPPQNACTVPPGGDFDGYIRLFDTASKAIESSRSAITGEASSNTFTASNVWLRGHDPKKNNPEGVTMAELIREAQPYTRLIVIFRDPVQRYLSAFHYYRNRSQPPPSAEDLHARATQEVQEWDSCVKASGVRACISRFHPQQLIKGMYAEFLDDWFQHFPRSQILFLRNEDYAAATEEHMRAVFRFLGMREPVQAEWSSIMAMDKRNAQAKQKPMLPHTRKMLEEFYAPFNAKLADRLGDQRYLWADTKGAA